jgi:hypothetical protein
MSSIQTEVFSVNDIIQNFCIEGNFSEAKIFGSGHINDTFLVKNTQVDQPDYLLQRINHHVFKDVSGVIDNIYMVTSHLKNKLKEVYGNGVDKRVLSLIPAKDRKLFVKDSNGNFWRMYIFMTGAKSYDLVTSDKQAREGGRAFGEFQSLLSDMNPKLLSETIVDFHNIIKRLKDFDIALENDVLGRKASIADEIAFIRKREDEMSTIYKWGKADLIPQRITHNDTKFNNILFDRDDKAQCIIDLDTVMSGYIAYDFGDAIRTLINTTVEDEQELSKIHLNIPLFKAYTEGYAEKASGFITPKEVDSLYFGMMLLPYMQGVRFLTDYLQGDTYFKTAYQEHNLIRTQAQFHLLSKMEDEKDLLSEIIQESFNR